MRSFSLATGILLLVTSVLAAPFPSEGLPVLDTGTVGLGHPCNASATTTDTTTASTATSTPSRNAKFPSGDKGPTLKVASQKAWIHSTSLFRRRVPRLSPEQVSAMKAGANSALEDIQHNSTINAAGVRLYSAAKKGWIQGGHLLRPRQEVDDPTVAVDGSTIAAGGSTIAAAAADMTDGSTDSTKAGFTPKNPKFFASSSVPWIQGRRRRGSAM